MGIRFVNPTPPPCADCGSSPVFHGAAWLSALADTGVASLARRAGRASQEGAAPESSHAPMDHIGRISAPYLPSIFRGLARIGLGTITTEIDDRDFKFVTHCLWEEAGKRGIVMWQFRPFGLVKNIFVAERDGRHIVFERMPLPPGAGTGPAWIDDKAELKKWLSSASLPVPRGGVFMAKKKALAEFKALRALGLSVIVKPARGSGTRHTTLHLQDEAAFIRAFASAKRLSPSAIVEEELIGDVYRPTLVGGKLIATLARFQPFVVGDGIRFVEALIAAENEHPKRRGPIFSPIAVTPETHAELARQGMTLASVPKRGARITLHQKLNWSVGGTTRDVTAEVHPDNRALFETIARMLGAHIVGLDFIVGDIARSWKEQPGCGIIEANSMPFFDNHHLPFEGEPQNVAAAIWKCVFPDEAS